MAEPARQTGDRLPWLTEVPRSAPPQPATKRKLQLPLLAFLLGALFALIAIGAYWLGSQSSGGGEEASRTAERPGMTAQVDTSAEAEAQERANAAAQPDEPANAALASDAESAAAEPDVAPRPRAVVQTYARSRREVSERIVAAPRRTVVTRTRSTRDSARTGAPVSLQPVVRGRIIQTGAYPDRAQAELAWRALVTKWPYLSTKPRLISPLEVRSSDGRATQMFRVQLATASQAQSVVICQRLAAMKQSCVVVY